jgi:hypothetical protein
MVASPGKKIACRPSAEEGDFGASCYCYALQNYLASEHDYPSNRGHLDSSGLVWIKKGCPRWTGFFVGDSSSRMSKVQWLVIVFVSSRHALSMAIALVCRCQVSAFYGDRRAKCGLEGCESVDAEIVTVYQNCEAEI